MLLQTYLSVNKDLNFSVFRTDMASADLGNIGYIQTVSYNIICGHQGADINMRVIEIAFEFAFALYFSFQIRDNMSSVYRERRYRPHILGYKIRYVNDAQDLLRTKSSAIILSVISPYSHHISEICLLLRFCSSRCMEQMLYNCWVPCPTKPNGFYFLLKKQNESGGGAAVTKLCNRCTAKQHRNCNTERNTANLVVNSEIYRCEFAQNDLVTPINNRIVCESNRIKDLNTELTTAYCCCASMAIETTFMICLWYYWFLFDLKLQSSIASAWGEKTEFFLVFAFQK